MTLGSLFSGIDGLALGLERAGMRTVWHAEIDPFCCEVLAQHWPGVPNLGDVTKIDWAAVPAPDVLCGVFPCQPASVAGQRRGVEDDRWLWPCFAAAIRALRPRYVIAENVPGLLTVSGGDAFGEVLADLAALGYDAEWAVFPASAVGAPHRRERVWIVAYTSIRRAGPVERRIHEAADRCWSAAQPGDGGALAHAAGDGRREGRAEPAAQQRGSTTAGSSGELVADAGEQPRRSGLRAGEPPAQRRLEPGDGSGAMADPERCRQQAAGGDRLGGGAASDGEQRQADAALADRRLFQLIRLSDYWRDSVLVRNRPVKPGLCVLADGVPRRVAKLRALGNAVVPQVAEYVGRCVMAHAEAQR